MTHISLNLEEKLCSQDIQQNICYLVLYFTDCEKADDLDKGKQLSTEWKSHIYTVIKDYKRKKIDELNLKIGKESFHFVLRGNLYFVLAVCSSSLLVLVFLYTIYRQVTKCRYPMSALLEPETHSAIFHPFNRLFTCCKNSVGITTVTVAKMPVNAEK